ncbi:MAG: amidohydrolase [bacterium]|nr:amidohydrolase [bacterium]
MVTTGERELKVVPGRRPPFLIHAEQEAEEQGLYDFPIVDVDSHIADEMDTRKLAGYMRNPNIVRAFEKYRDLDFRRLFMGWNLGDRPIAARSKTYGLWEDLPEEIPEGMPRTVAASAQFMDRTGIDYLVSFPTSVLAIGSMPQREMQNEAIWAYNRWLVEDTIPWDRRILAMPSLPVNDPEQSLATVRYFADNPNVVGWMITAARVEPVHEREYLPLWAEIEEIGKPVAFHSAPDWKERPFEVMGRFFGPHGLGFSFYSMLHLTNIVLSGLVERFPKIRWIFIESGQSWVPFVMSRLDQQYRMRSSEAPQLQRLPSEYIREMYFTTQPFEEHSHEPEVGRAIFDLTNGAQSWLYASDYPHHDFDVPGMLYGQSYWSEEEKRAVLGGNAMRLFGLPDELPTRVRRQEAQARG